MENELLKKSSSLNLDFGLAWDLKLMIWTVEWLSGMVFGWDVLVIHKLTSPFRTSIDYRLSFCFTLLWKQIISTFESFFVYFLVKFQSLLLSPKFY